MPLMYLLLPWFPIILGVGVGGRLLGRSRGIGLGIICAVFWVLLVQASVGVAVWGNLLAFSALLAGSGAIIAMGAWSGELPLPRGESRAVGNGAPSQNAHLGGRRESADSQFLVDALQRFEEWLEAFRHDADPWAKFDEFIRDSLRRACGATHTTPLRLMNDGTELVPLRAYDPFSEVEHISPRGGVIGHTLTTGRSFILGDSTQGELVAKLAEEGTPPAWCFSIRQGSQRLGVIVVGRLDLPPEHHHTLLCAMEKLTNLWWLTVREICVSREAVRGDPVSGLVTREVFLRVAEQASKESYARGEPVALAAEIRQVECGCPIARRQHRYLPAALAGSAAGGPAPGRVERSRGASRREESRPSAAL
ncbi:MAG: hypothetical protein IH987_19760, partial [Planctomycetes bacterium]|nr:hypothetical protein [Planctomycetota bacterium]